MIIWGGFSEHFGGVVINYTNGFNSSSSTPSTNLNVLYHWEFLVNRHIKQQQWSSGVIFGWKVIICVIESDWIWLSLKKMVKCLLNDTKILIRAKNEWFSSNFASNWLKTTQSTLVICWGYSWNKMIVKGGFLEHFRRVVIDWTNNFNSSSSTTST